MNTPSNSGHPQSPDSEPAAPAQATGEPAPQADAKQADADAAKQRRGPAARRAEAALRGKSDRPSKKDKKQGYQAAPLQDEAADADTLNATPDADDQSGTDADVTPAPAAREPGAVAWDTFSDITSGRFDVDAQVIEGEAGEEAAAKRVLAPQADAPKLHKVLAQAGMGSRLEMERMIAEGRIWVNSAPAHVGQRIQFGDVVKVNGKPVRVRIEPPPARVIAYHKPEGEVVSHNDPQNRPTVFRGLPRLQSGKWQSVGRLDLNTEGLLLFTNSGGLANRLMHPRFGLQRQYAVRVLGALSKEEKQRLLDGVQLDDGPAQFSEVEDGGGEGANQWYRVTISEGRNREVRRMLEAVGHAVSRLIRIRYGAMVLPRGLRRGHWMELDDHDIRALTDAVGLPQVGHEVRPDFQRDLRVQRSEGGRNPDRSRGGPRGSGGPLSQREQKSNDRRQASIGQPRRTPSNTWGDQSQWGDRANWAGQAPEGGDEHGQQAQRPQGQGQGRGQQNQGGAGRAQPDPLRTSQGYIGGESFMRQRKSDGKRPSGGGRSATGRTGTGRSGSSRTGGRGR